MTQLILSGGEDCMKKIIALFFSVTLIMLMTAGCGTKEKATSENEINVNENTEDTEKRKTDADEGSNKENTAIGSEEIVDDADDNTQSNTPDSANDKVNQKIYYSETAGYSGQEIMRVDFRAKTHAQAEDMDGYYATMEEKGQFTRSSLIPPELCELIVKAMDEKTEKETFEPLKTGTEIGQEEFSGLTGVELMNMEAVMAVKVDADNDGIEDIAGEYYYGGTGGFSGMQLYKGSGDGNFNLTSSFECFSQAYDFIQYQGKNYLLMEEFDYNTKQYSGYSLYLYEDGKLADGKRFSFVIDDYDMEIVYEDLSYEDLEIVKNTLSNPKMPEILEDNDGVIIGTAETINSDEEFFPYAGDLDNDGAREKYDKYMWYPSNMATVMHLIYYFEDSSILDDLSEKLAEEVGDGFLYAFWLDEVNGKNILYLYYGKNPDFTLYAFLIKKSN